MYFDYRWIKEYLKSAPSLAEAADILSLTGLETEVDGEGLEIEHTVNRPDAMSHFGVARELAVKLQVELIEPPGYSADIPPLNDWAIVSHEPEACSRYMGLKIEGVRAEPSPAWLREKLDSIGQTCHNLPVDLTNFLLWEYGHPSHAFDADKIQGQKIVIRYGKVGERLTTLDGRDHSAEQLLCIADESTPIAFGGVMGGENSEVTESTTSLLLELGCFRPTDVRATGRKCTIESDARHRFERGVDREKMDRVIRRYIGLLLKEQPTARVIGLYDMDLAPFRRVEIVLRRARLERVLGICLSDQRVFDLLVSMDCLPKPIAEGWRVAVPGYKVDVVREIDLIEEVIRFAGIELLVSQQPAMAGSDFKPDPLRDGEDAIRSNLWGYGLQETCTYSFLPEPAYRIFAAESEPVRLKNPMNENQAVMRRYILPTLLDTVRKNLSRGLANIRFFEIGHVFEGVTEPHHLAMVLTESADRSDWWPTINVPLFFKIKGFFEAMKDQLGWRELSLKSGAPSYLNADESLGIYWRERMIGGLGALASDQAAFFGIETSVAVLEMDLVFLERVTGAIPEVTELSPFPGMRVDMAFVVNREHAYGAMHDFLTKMSLPNLESLSLFDVYEGKSIEAGKRSLGFRFQFQAIDRTLTSEEVAKTMDQVVAAVRQRFGAHVRI